LADNDRIKAFLKLQKQIKENPKAVANLLKRNLVADKTTKVPTK
jgi:hypothetical protein